MPAPKNTTVTLEHPMHRGVDIQVETVTPAIAEAWLSANKDNRSQRPKVIAAYGRDMVNGEWLFTGESIKFDWNDRLIDGQHRLEAVIATGVSIRTVVVRNLDPRVQYVLDTAAKRTAGDALRFAGVTIQPKDIASIARVSITFHSGRLRNALDSAKVDVTHSEVLAWHHENPDVETAVVFTSRIWKKVGGTIAGLGFAVLTLMRIDAADTIEFFESSAEFRTNGTGDPRKAMLDAFGKIRSERRTPTPAEQLAIVFRAWNAWREQKELRLIRSGASDGKGGITGVTIVEPK